MAIEIERKLLVFDESWRQGVRDLGSQPYRGTLVEVLRPRLQKEYRDPSGRLAPEDEHAVFPGTSDEAWPSH